MHPPVASVSAVARTRPTPAVAAPPAVPDAPGGHDAFAPQLARACERGSLPGLNSTARPELNPVSDLAGLGPLRLAEVRLADSTAAARDADDSSSDQTEDESDPAAEEEEGPITAVAAPAPTAPLVTLSPLALRLNHLAGATAEPSAPAGAALAELPFAAAESALTKPAAPEPTTPAKPSAAPPAPVPAPPPPPPPPAGGTSVAPESAQMNVAQDMNKTSGPAEQNLPSAPPAAAWLAEQAGARTLSARHPHVPGDAASAVAAFIAAPTPVAAAEHAVVAAPPVAAADPTARVLALMAGAVVQFRRTGTDDFDVSIRPDPDTEINLRVSLAGTGVEIQAELRRGDAAALAARWPDLQERLAQQGIKLAALAEGETLSGGAQQDSRSPAQPPEGEPGPVVVPATTHTTTAPAPAPPGRARGWETWA